MPAGKLTVISMGAALAIGCCATPSLVIAFGSLGLSAWSASAFVLIPIFLLALGSVGVWLHRRGRFTPSANADRH